MKNPWNTPLINHPYQVLFMAMMTIATVICSYESLVYLVGSAGAAGSMQSSVP